MYPDSSNLNMWFFRAAEDSRGITAAPNGIYGPISNAGNLCKSSPLLPGRWSKAKQTALRSQAIGVGIRVQGLVSA